MSDSSDSNSGQTPPVLKKRTLITAAPSSGNAGPKLVSEAEQATAMPRARFLTPAMKQQIEAEQAQQAEQAEQEAARIAAEQEAARIAAEQEAARIAAEQEAARIAEEQEAARIAAEEEAARIAAEQEAARIAEEQKAQEIQEAARIASEQKAARIAAEQAANQQPETSNTSQQDALDPKIQNALDQIRLAQEALAAAQKQALEMASLASAGATTTSSSPTPEPPAPEPEKKTLFKVGGLAAPKNDAPQTADSLKEKIAASLNKATSGNTSSLEPSPILHPSATTPVAQQEQPVALQPVPEVMPEAIWKKKSFKIGMIIAGCVVILSGVLITMALNARAEQRRQNQYLTELCKVGSELGKKAAEIGGTTGSDLKYDEARYKIKVTPNEKDAKLLLNRIGSKEQQGGWEAAAHLLGVMGQLDPKIAKMIVDELGNNPKLYTDAHYMMLISVLACDKDEKIQKLFPPLLKKLELARQDKKQSIVLKQMRYGMTPADIPSFIKYLTDPKANGEMANAARECLRSITFNSDALGKAVVSNNLIAELRKAPGDNDLPVAQRAGLLNALALSGTQEAQAYFQEYLKDKNPSQIRIALRSLGEWGNDNIVPYLMELRKDPVMTADKTIKNDLNRILLQRLSKDGERTEEQGTALFKPLIDEAEELTKNTQDPEAVENAQMLKMLIVSATGQLKERPYVTNIINLYKNDPDEKVSSTAKKVEQRMKQQEQKSREKKTSAADKAKEWEKRFAQ